MSDPFRKLSSALLTIYTSKLWVSSCSFAHPLKTFVPGRCHVKKRMCSLQKGSERSGTRAGATAGGPRGGRRLAAAFELCGATLKRLKSFSTAYETLTRLKQWAHRKEWTQHACARTDTREQQDDGEGKSCSAEGESATRGSARKRSSNVQREEKSWAFATWSGRPSSEDHQ